MKVASSPGIFQNVMKNIFADMSKVRSFIDDILVAIKGSYEQRLVVLNKVLKLPKKGFKINLRNSLFAVE
jgi:hypothetical protein